MPIASASSSGDDADRHEQRGAAPRSGRGRSSRTSAIIAGVVAVDDAPGDLASASSATASASAPRSRSTQRDGRRELGRRPGGRRALRSTATQLRRRPERRRGRRGRQDVDRLPRDRQRLGPGALGEPLRGDDRDGARRAAVAVSPSGSGIAVSGSFCTAAQLVDVDDVDQ